MPHQIPRPAALALALVVAAACGSDEAPGRPLGELASADSARRVAEAHSILGADAQARLDSGNTEYRAKRHAAALTHYRAAAGLAPQHAAPLFGIYMVAKATSNAKLADSALAEIRKRNGPVPPAAHGFPDSAVAELHKKLGARGPTG